GDMVWLWSMVFSENRSPLCAGAALRVRTTPESNGHAARPFADERHGGGPGGGFKATRGNFEAGHALIARDRRRAAGTHRVQEGDQFGTQRLIMADRQMAHGIAAVRLEAEAFSDLARQ